MLNRVRLWIRSVVLRRRLEREMQDEIAGHLEQSTERLIARGLSPDEARREAMREFGNVAYLQEEGRLARGTGWLDALIADSRYALRQFGRRPGTTIVMLVVLVVGMSTSTLLFSYVYAYAVQPPPGVAQEEDLVRIRGSRSAGAAGRASRPLAEEEFLQYTTLTDHFSGVAGWTDAFVALDAGDDPDLIGLDARVTFVTESYFPVLSVRPVLGPGLPTGGFDEPAMAATAVIGHTTWDQLFGQNPDVIGSTIGLNGVPVTIVGVAPERFIGMGPLARHTLWMPVQARSLVTPSASDGFRAAGRLRPGVSRESATAATRVVAARVASTLQGEGAADPGADREGADAGVSTEVVPLRAANADPMFERDVRLMTLLVGLLGLLVLLVTCTNVSALLTGLATARRHEIAVRLSLGAARARLIRQLLTESVLLASIAAAAALGVVWLVLRMVMKLIPYFPLEMGINWPVTLFIFGIALAVGTLFGVSPALHATRLALESALRQTNATMAAARGRLQRGLVVAQIAFTQPLVVLLAAVLFLVVQNGMPQSRTAFADQLIRLSLLIDTSQGGSSAQGAESRRQVRATMDRLVDRLRSMPGVEFATLDHGSASPLGPYSVHPEDRVDPAAPDVVRLAGERRGEGYFQMTGISLLRGRGLEPSDAASTVPPEGEAPIVIGVELARSLWSGADPIGRRLLAASDTAPGARTLVVVGVFRDPQARPTKAGQDHRIFLPPDTSRLSTMVLLRTAGPAEPHLPTLRGIVHEMAPGTRFRLRTVAAIEDEERRNFTLVAGGVSAAGLAALLLSAIGLYAVVAFSVGQRTREIAVRIAVGARARQVVNRFIGDGLRLSAVGLLIGLPLSLIGLRLLISLDEDLQSVSLPTVTAIAALGVALVGTAAAWIPARRAASVDPATTLRSG